MADPVSRKIGEKCLCKNATSPCWISSLRDYRAKTGDKNVSLGPLPTGRREARCIPADLISQTLAVPQPWPGGGVGGGFVWLGLLPAVPRAPSLNMTPSSLVSVEEA